MGTSSYSRSQIKYKINVEKTCHWPIALLRVFSVPTTYFAELTSVGHFSVLVSICKIDFEVK